MEVAPDVQLIEIPDPRIARLYAVNVYLIGREEAILIDSGDGRDESNSAILEAINRFRDRRLSYVVITHGHNDHFGGIPAIKAATGAKIAAHRANLAEIEEELGSAVVDIPLQGGENLKVAGVELTVVHTPGHSAGDISLFDPTRKVVFTGDTVLGVGTVVIGLHASDTMSQYMHSLRRLQALGAGVLCPGHGPVVQNAHTRIQEVFDHRLMREDQIVAALGQGIKTSKELVAKIYVDVDPRLHGMAESNVLAHLLKLENEGRVREQKEGENTIYVLAGQ